MAFATSADLEQFLGRDLTNAEAYRADLLLDSATETIRGFCRQYLTQVSGDVVVLVGNWSSVLVLPERPVTAISAVAISTSSLTVNTDYAWDGADKLYRGSRVYPEDTYTGSPLPYRHELHWGGPSAQVSVTYTHGFADGHRKLDLVKGMCCELVAAALAVTPGIRQEALGQYSYTAEPGASRVTELSGAQKRLLRDAGLRR